MGNEDKQYVKHSVPLAVPFNRDADHHIICWRVTCFDYGAAVINPGCIARSQLTNIWEHRI